MTDRYTLAIDTATSQVGVALAGPGGPVASLHLRQGRRHGEALAPAIEILSRLTGVALAEVGSIAVDLGPGLFTGLRVGIATAKALADALGVPVVGCSSLDVLAHRHASSRRSVAAVVDARRGEVFWALYAPAEGGMAPLTEPAVSTPEDLAASLVAALSSGLDAPARGGILATGDGARRYAAVLGAVAGVEIDHPDGDHPSATVLADLAAGRPSVDAARITPIYLRSADVRIGWQQRDG